MLLAHIWSQIHRFSTHYFFPLSYKAGTASRHVVKRHTDI